MAKKLLGRLFGRGRVSSVVFEVELVLPLSQPMLTATNQPTQRRKRIFFIVCPSFKHVKPKHNPQRIHLCFRENSNGHLSIPTRKNRQSSPFASYCGRLLFGLDHLPSGLVQCRSTFFWRRRFGSPSGGVFRFGLLFGFDHRLLFRLPAAVAGVRLLAAARSGLFATDQNQGTQHDNREQLLHVFLPFKKAKLMVYYHCRSAGSAASSRMHEEAKLFPNSNPCGKYFAISSELGNLHGLIAIQFPSFLFAKVGDRQARRSGRSGSRDDRSRDATRFCVRMTSSATGIKQVGVASCMHRKDCMTWSCRRERAA